jgi:hypothetical protein
MSTRKYFLLIFMSLGISISSFSQDYPETEAVFGFGCGFIGAPTGPITVFELMLEAEDFEAVRSRLFSENNAEKFLAVMTCKQLVDRDLISLTETESMAIIKLEQSQDPIALCNGCIYGDTKPMWVMLNEGEKCREHVEVDKWLNRLLD